MRRRSGWRRERTCGFCCVRMWCDGQARAVEEWAIGEAVALPGRRAGEYGGRLGEESEHANGGGRGICAHETDSRAGGASAEESQGGSAGGGADCRDRGLQEDGGVDTSLSSLGA